MNECVPGLRCNAARQPHVFWTDELVWKDGKLMTRLAALVVLVGVGMATTACATAQRDDDGFTYHNERQEYRADNSIDRGRGN